MRHTIRTLSLPAVVLALAGGALAQQPPAHATRIPFADIGNIRDWRASSSDELYIQSMDRQWFRTTFFAPCTALPYATAIAFVTEPNGELNSFSSVLVEGERCWFRTFASSEEPPAKRK
jgi:hypothetical protein